MMNKNVRIAKELVRLAKTLVADEQRYDFKSNSQYGPAHLLKVMKMEPGFAYQIQEEDVELLKEAKSRENGDKPYEAKAGDWILTGAKMSKKAGKFWILTPSEFKKAYKSEHPMNNDTIVGSPFDGALKDVTFECYAPNESQLCFRLPENMPKNKVEMLGGNNFTGGSYVFIKDGKCDIWERSIDSMSNYDLIDGKGDASKVDMKTVVEEYKQINPNWKNSEVPSTYQEKGR